MKASAVIEKDADGYYAYCPQMPGCHTQGETFEEVMNNIHEALALYLETLSPEEIEALSSKLVLTTTVEI